MHNRYLVGIVFLTGLAISGTAAYYSIVGLTAIFAGSFWSVVIMGSALEVGKLVAISWLYQNWTISGKALKAYLFLAIAVLMAITSMGIYGFLSKAHIEHTLTLTTGSATKLKIINQKILDEEEKVADYDKQIGVIDKAVGTISESKKTKDAKDALKVSADQKGNRDELVKKRDELKLKIQGLKEERIPIEAEVKKMEAEVGPVKYIAQVFFDNPDDPAILEKAIRGVIILLIIVFDPLAIVLMLCFNVSMRASEQMEFLDVTLPRPTRKPRKKPRHLRKRKKLNG